MIASNTPNFEADIEKDWHLNPHPPYAKLFMDDASADIRYIPLLNAKYPPKKFPAHREALKSRTVVFGAQFHYDEINGLIPVQGIKEVLLPDIEPDAFEQFLRFCYTNEVTLTNQNATAILDIANRYNIRPLVEKCIDYICTIIDWENAFEMLTFGRQFGYTLIQNQALKTVIEDYQGKSLGTDGFLNLSPKGLLFFVSQHCLGVEECLLFKAMCRWAERRMVLEQQNSSNFWFDQGKKRTIREVLGVAFKEIDFLQMEPEDFEAFVVPTGVLTDEEVELLRNEFATPYEMPDLSELREKWRAEREQSKQSSGESSGIRGYIFPVNMDAPKESMNGSNGDGRDRSTHPKKFSRKVIQKKNRMP